MDQEQWLSADGGPHLVLPQEALGLWRCAFGAGITNTSAATNYDAACEFTAAGLLSIGFSAGLVFGDDPPATTWVPSSHFLGGLLVVPIEWESWPDLPDCDVRQFLEQGLTRSLFVRTGMAFPVRSQMVLVCAGDCGPDWAYGQRPIRIEPGLYEVLEGEYTTPLYRFKLYALDKLAGKPTGSREAIMGGFAG
jgi:hypothetical protein